MDTHFDLTDLEFKTTFEAKTFNPKLFTHEAHVRLAWIYLNTYDVEQAIEAFCTQFVDFVTLYKAKGKYNKTLTIAAIYIINHFKTKSASGDFKTFILEYPELVTEFKHLIELHYSLDVYASVQAKQYYIEPDLQPFVV